MPLKLPLSCEVGPKRWICRGSGYPRFWICVFKLQLLPSMWPILVEFRSASSEIRRRKKEKKNPGKIQVRRHTVSGGLTNRHAESKQSTQDQHDRKTQFISKNYAEKLSSTLLSNAIKWIKHIKFSRVMAYEVQIFWFLPLLLVFQSAVLNVAKLLI